MSQRGWLFVSVVLLISVGFAGCLGDEEKPDTGDDVGSGTDDTGAGGEGNSTSDGDDPTGGDLGEAPSAVFDVLAEDTVLTGANVTFNASASSDPEGGNLTFAWDLGDNTTAEGIEVVHVYAEAGNYTVVLTVTDADGMTATANETITVEAANVGYTDEMEGSVAVPNPVFAARSGDKSDYVGVEGTNYAEMEFTGIPTGGSKLTFDIESAATGAAIVVFDPDGKRLGGSKFPSGTQDVVLEAEDALGHGTYTVYVYSWATPNISFKLTATLE